eukprot:GEMP01025579.1.p1 GENE.GEMP01025579.1~~GEMP01025579.1.p1  ORF type:complete len:605 (+),score=121.45 GEMP01025579.1:108-1922(+)
MAVCFYWLITLSSAECTAIALGRLATVEKTTITTHNDDTATSDSRVAFVNRHTATGRPIFPLRMNFPRHVGGRSVTYAPAPGSNQVATQPIGSIPQNGTNYAYYEAGYGLINEMGVTIGESTCTGKLYSNYSNGALLAMPVLTQLALERCATAVCAVETMGNLGQQFGFVGSGGTAEAGEAIVVGDGHEAWVFHILSDGAKSAVWVAQRIPDNHLAIVANNFIIREVDCHDKSFFRCSSNMYSVALANGLWRENEVFDFAKVYGQDVTSFSFLPNLPPIPLYASLRMWRVQGTVAPSLNLQVNVDPLNFAFSVPVDRPVSLATVRALTRDYYEGTEFDMSQGVFAGPFKSFFRMEGGPGLKAVPGQFPRAISIPRTNYAVIGQSYGLSPLSLTWFSADAPVLAVFVPFYSQTQDFALTYRVGNKNEFSRDSAWWAFNAAATLVYQQTSLMKPEVDRRIASWEQKIDEERITLSHDPKSLEKFQTKIQNEVAADWWQMSDWLLCRYNDGFLNEPNNLGQTIGYPPWWLEMVGFNDDPRPKWVHPSDEKPSLLGDAVLPSDVPTTTSENGSSLVLFILVAVGSYIAGVVVGVCRTRTPSDYVALAP